MQLTNYNLQSKVVKRLVRKFVKRQNGSFRSDAFRG